MKRKVSSTTNHSIYIFNRKTTCSVNLDYFAHLLCRKDPLPTSLQLPPSLHPLSTVVSGPLFRGHFRGRAARHAGCCTVSGKSPLPIQELGLTSKTFSKLRFLKALELI